MGRRVQGCPSVSPRVRAGTTEIPASSLTVVTQLPDRDWLSQRLVTAALADQHVADPAPRGFPTGRACECQCRTCGNALTRDRVRIRPFCYAQRRHNAQRHDAQRRDAQRRDARRPCHPDDDDTSDVKRKRRLEGLALAVCFIPKSQTCNGYELNSFR